MKKLNLLKKNDGFTLLESMITVSLIALGTNMAITSLSNMEPAENLRNESLKVRDALLKARAMAQKNLRCTEVKFFPNRIDLTPYENCSPNLENPMPSEKISLSSRVRLSTNSLENSVVFTPQGATLTTTPATITLASDVGRTFKYTITPTLGAVSMR